MKTYSIPDTLASVYHGSGWALAAIASGQVVALRYVDDVADVALADQLDGDHAAFFVRQWMQTQEAAPVVRELQALGRVSVGMCSSGEFMEL